MSKLEELIEKELEERKGKMRGPYAKFSNQRYYLNITVWITHS